MSVYQAAQTLYTKSTLAINNLPKTFVHGDVFRLLRKAQINERQVKGVHLDYYRFLRTGKAYVSFNDQNQAEDAIAQMRQAKNIVGKLDVFLKGPIYPPGRSRGVKGREAAVQRGAIYGEGADAGISQRGRGVVIYGLPRNVRQEELAQLAQNNLVQLEGGGQTNYNIYKLEDIANQPSPTTRVVIMTESSDDAQRLVRRVHMAPFKTSRGNTLTLRADVVY